jgi:hypothetical protein
MKKIIFSFIVSLMFCSYSHAEIDEIMGLSLDTHDEIMGLSTATHDEVMGQTIAGLVCTDYIDAYTTATRDLWIPGPGMYSGQNYRGIVFDDGSSGTICEVKWFLGNTGGTPSLNDYYCEVWLLDVSNNHSLLIGRSGVVTGAAWGAGTLVTFASINAAYDCSGTNKYGIELKGVDTGDPVDTVGEIDTTNYISIGGDDEADTMVGNEGSAYWDGSGVYTLGDAEDDPMIIIRTLQ